MNNNNNSQGDKPRVGSAIGKAVCYLLLFFGWQFIVTMGYTSSIMYDAMAQGWDMYTIYDMVYAKVMEISAISGLLTLASVVLFMKIRRRSLRQELWLRPVPAPLLGWCAGLAFCMYWLVSLVLSLLPESMMAGYLEASSGVSETGFLAIVSTAIIAPVVEEVIFRGLIYTRLQRAMRPVTAVLVSAFVFAFCHGQAIWFCYAYILGLVFAHLTRMTNSIVPAVLMHVVFNSTNELLLILGDWEPGIVVWILIAVVGVAGSAFCARRVWGLASEFERANIRTEEESVPEFLPELPVQPQPEVQVKKPVRAAWDDDSGPDHKFPPQLR